MQIKRSLSAATHYKSPPLSFFLKDEQKWKSNCCIQKTLLTSWIHKPRNSRASLLSEGGLLWTNILNTRTIHSYNQQISLSYHKELTTAYTCNGKANQQKFIIRGRLARRHSRYVPRDPQGQGPPEHPWFFFIIYVLFEIESVLDWASDMYLLLVLTWLTSPNYLLVNFLILL